MNLFKLAAELFEEGANGEPPIIVWIFVGIWVFFMIGIPVIIAISSARQKRQRMEREADEARRKMMQNETVKTPLQTETARYDAKDDYKNRLLGTLSRINPELQQRLDDTKKTKELKKTKDNIQGNLKPHGHKDEKSQKDLYGSLDYCDFDDFFAQSAIGSVEETEIGDTEDVMEFYMLSDNELTPEEAAELIILGDIINNPKTKRRYKI